jgi:hypothetical protein
MVLDFGVSNIPMPVFMLVHVVGFLIGAYLAWKSFGGGLATFGWAFTLYAIAEVLYMGYHLDISTFLLSHTLAEVCDLVAFILAFVGVSQNVLNRTNTVKATTSTRA